MANVNQNSIYNPLIQVQTRVVITKHTPGPWENATRLGGARQIELSKKWRCIIGKRKTEMSLDMVATVFGATKEQAEANARLIAAAPELLEALIEILPIAETMINSNHPTWKKAKSAILKATGEKEVAA